MTDMMTQDNIRNIVKIIFVDFFKSSHKHLFENISDIGIYKFHTIESYDRPSKWYILNTRNNNRIEVHYDTTYGVSCYITDLNECVSQQEQKQDSYRLWFDFKSNKPATNIPVKALLHDMINNLSIASIKYMMLVMMTYRGTVDKRI